MKKRFRGITSSSSSTGLSGEPSDQQPVHRDDVNHWQFYDFDAEMRAYYEEYASKLEAGGAF